MPLRHVACFLESVMAEQSKELLEKLWIAKSLSNMRQALTRSRDKEMVGSEIWMLRGREIEALSALIVKYGG